jgi:hypothetical protein
VADDKDIFGRADALLRRTATGSDTGAVPLLTELVEEAPKATAPGAGAMPAGLTGALAQEVFNRVMSEVEGRLAAELERRLAQHLVPQVHAAVASALGDLHQELANTIGDAVAQALAHRGLK